MPRVHPAASTFRCRTRRRAGGRWHQPSSLVTRAECRCASPGCCSHRRWSGRISRWMQRSQRSDLWQRQLAFNAFDQLPPGTWSSFWTAECRDQGLWNKWWWHPRTGCGFERPPDHCQSEAGSRRSSVSRVQTERLPHGGPGERHLRATISIFGRHDFAGPVQSRSSGRRVVRARSSDQQGRDHVEHGGDPQEWVGPDPLRDRHLRTRGAARLRIATMGRRPGVLGQGP